MSKKQRVIYYSDELNDEFADDNIVAKKIDGNYRYLSNSIWGKLRHLFWYRIIAFPIAFLYMKIYFRHSVVNRQVLKQNKNIGYFMYGNHTHFLADALNPTLVNVPKDVAVIVHPNNVSMPILGKITPSLGALPLPSDMAATKNFLNAIGSKIKNQSCIMIYPEAHIWPYYTDIRPFKDTSFRYPVQYDMPVYCLTNTYKKRKYSKRPKMVTYIDGPFYSDKNKTSAEQKKQLRDVVYNTMKYRALNNEVCMIRYEKLNNND